MSSAAVLSISSNRFLAHLEEQQRAFGAETPDLLLVRCDEPEPQGPPAWVAAAGPAFHLSNDGADVDGLQLREAIHAAVQDYGVRRVAVVLHSECAHASPTAASSGDRGGDVIARIAAVQERKHRGLEAARARIRAAVRSLGRDPALEGVEILGAVHVVESGALQAYVAERDAFEALA